MSVNQRQTLCSTTVEVTVSSEGGWSADDMVQLFRRRHGEARAYLLHTFKGDGVKRLSIDEPGENPLVPAPPMPGARVAEWGAIYSGRTMPAGLEVRIEGDASLPMTGLSPAVVSGPDWK